jgi:hypothetical protein
LWRGGFRQLYVREIAKDVSAASHNDTRLPSHLSRAKRSGALARGNASLAERAASKIFSRAILINRFCHQAAVIAAQSRWRTGAQCLGSIQQGLMAVIEHAKVGPWTKIVG